MKKKFIALFLTALCAVSLLGGCGKTDETAVNNSTDKVQTKKTTSVTLNEVAHSIK